MKYKKMFDLVGIVDF